MNIRATLLRWSIPLQKLMQKMHPPEPTTDFDEVSRVFFKLREGDILLSREAWHFTNLFIPGFWSHAALVSPGSNRVIEAVAPKVRAVPFTDWAIRKHNWCVIRPDLGPLYGTLESGVTPIKMAEKYLGRDYDYLFKESDEAFFCSELVYSCWRGLWTDFDWRRTFGKWTVTPDDFYRAAMKTKKANLIHLHIEDRHAGSL